MISEMRRRMRGERREGAQSRKQTMMIRIIMKEVEKGEVIIPLLSRENMRDTLSLGRVKVKSHIINEFVPR